MFSKGIRAIKAPPIRTILSRLVPLFPQPVPGRPDAPPVPDHPPVAEQGLRAIYVESRDNGVLPQITLVVPAFEKPAGLAATLRNLATLDYPPHRLQVVVICDDHCASASDVALRACAEHRWEHLKIRIINRGSDREAAASVEDVVLGVSHGLVGIVPIPSLLAPDALQLVVGHFSGSDVGVVAAENAVGVVCVFRRRVFTPARPGIAQTGCALVASIVAQGFRAVHETRLWIPEQPLSEPCAAVG